MENNSIRNKIIRIGVLTIFVSLVLTLRVLNATLNSGNSQVLELNKFYFLGYATSQILMGIVLDKINPKIVRSLACLVIMPISINFILFPIELCLTNKVLMAILGILSTPAFLSCARGAEEISKDEVEFQNLLGISAGLGSLTMFFFPKLYVLSNFSKTFALYFVIICFLFYAILELLDFIFVPSVKNDNREKETLYKVLNETYQVIRIKGVLQTTLLSLCYCMSSFAFFAGGMYTGFVTDFLGFEQDSPLVLSTFSVFFFAFSFSYALSVFIGKALSFISGKTTILLFSIIRLSLLICLYKGYNSEPFLYFVCAFMGISSYGDIIMFGKVKSLISSEVVARGISLINMSHTMALPTATAISALLLFGSNESLGVLKSCILATSLSIVLTFLYFDINGEIILINKSNHQMNYMTSKSAGMDLVANEDKELNPLEVVTIKTGLFLKMPSNVEAQVRTRSGYCLKGIIVANSPGTIDPDYEGEVMICLTNIGKEKFEVKKGDKVAQLIFSNFIQAKPPLTIIRGKGGLGSTN